MHKRIIRNIFHISDTLLLIKKNYLSLAITYSSTKCSTIGASSLHFSVRNGKRCIPYRYNHHFMLFFISPPASDYSKNPRRQDVCRFPIRFCKSNLKRLPLTHRVTFSVFHSDGSYPNVFHHCNR